MASGASIDFRTLMETVPHIVWFCNTNAEIEFVSGHWTDYTGLSPEEAAVGQGYAKVMHPDDFQPTLDAVRRARDLRIPLSIMHRLRRFDGEYRWNHAHGNPVYAESGELRGWIGTSTDIEDQIQAQTRLENSEQQLRLITDAQPFLISYIDRNYHCKFINRASEKWFGKGPSELIGQPVWEVAGQSAYEDGKAEFDRALAGETLTYERLMTFKEGPRFIRVSLLPDRDKHGAVMGVFTTIADISEEKKTEQAIRESEFRFRSLADAMPQIVWTTTGEGEVDYFNRRFYEYTGCQTESLKCGCWEKALFEDDRRETRTKWHESLRTGTPLSLERRILRASDGMFRWHLSRAVPIKDETGKIIRWYGTDTDIHDSKILTEKLLKAQAEAEAASATKSAFLANMSHEIRTPMTAVLGFTEILRSPGFSDEEKQDALIRIENSGRSLLRVIDDVLDISKLEAGKLSIQKSVLSPAEICTDVISVMRLQADRKHIALKYEMDSSVPKVVNGDPARIRQILLNLVGNAVKFTAVGEVSLHLSFQMPDTLVFDVCDTGIGIAKEDQARLFRPFEQADPSITRKFGGTGLGLLLSLRLAEQMGGCLSLVRSELQKGSCFRLKISATPIQEAIVGPSSIFVAPGLRLGKATDRRLDGLKVLLAEDVADNQVLIRRYLTKAGVNLDIAVNGEEAVAMAQRERYDLILMDIQMPKLDGIQATRQLRALGFKAPILALTAHAMTEEVNRSLNAGCNAHLVKPINRDTLVSAISEFAHL